MISSIVMANLTKMSIDDVKKAYISRVLNEKKITSHIISWLKENSFQEIDACEKIIDAGDKEYLLDGRIVIRTAGKIWAIEKSSYDLIVENQIKNEYNFSKEKERKYCDVLIDGNMVCNGDLVDAPVCPRSDIGKYGYVKKTTCTVCGIEVLYRK